MHDDYRAQHILRDKMSNFTAVFWQKMPDFTEFFGCCSLNPQHHLGYLHSTKAYLRYLMSLAVISLLIAMLTAGPDRLYQVARSHVQL